MIKNLLKTVTTELAQDPHLDLVCLVHALLAILIVAVLEQLISCLPPRHQFSLGPTTKTNKKLITQNESTICWYTLISYHVLLNIGIFVLIGTMYFHHHWDQQRGFSALTVHLLPHQEIGGFVEEHLGGSTAWWKTWRNDADHGGYIRMDLRGSDTCVWWCLIMFDQSWLVGIQACWIHIVDLPQGGWSAMQLDVFVSLEAQTTRGIPTVKTFISCLQPKWHGVCII